MQTPPALGAGGLVSRIFPDKKALGMGGLGGKDGENAFSRTAAKRSGPPAGGVGSPQTNSG